MPKMNDQVSAICETVADLQALLHDHVDCGKHTAAEVAAKMHAILDNREVLQARHDVGYFPEPPPTPEEIEIALWTR